MIPAAPQPARVALRGRVVTMGDDFIVLPRGTIYIEDGSIVAVQPAEQPAPQEFAGLLEVDTEGTIYPGLIELHNHLSYNPLQLWQVPQKYGDRSEWTGIPKYQQLITQPMKVLGTSPGLMPAVVRYVECKCLLAGVTTSQGIALFSNKDAPRYYQGTVRVAEAPSDPLLPAAGSKIADVVATDRAAFLSELGTRKCFLLHLSEGVDDVARAHFQSLQFPDGTWAITDSLAGIHCVALQPADWQVMASHKASMVWSPLSNLLLYGGTADVATARAAGVRMSIGADWAPSGSKSLLGELKVAQIYAQETGIKCSDRDLVSMVTRNAAAILHWDHLLGTIEVGKHADLIVVDGIRDDAYSALVKAPESAITLVMIDGVARVGLPDLMLKLGVKGESVMIGQGKRTLNLTQSTQDPAVASVSLAEATQRLVDALKRLPELAQAPAAKVGMMASESSATSEPHWYLALDELGGTGMAMRPELTPQSKLTMTAAILAPHLPILPLKLDALTTVDDADFLDRLAAETNLPAFLVPALREIF
jgi:5-methylthioadenosine/S-adenosylhomocysteine deaminase